MPKSSVSVTNPENSKFPPGFTLPPLQASSHSRSLPGERGKVCGGGACIPQPSTNQKLDSLGDRLMFRLAYRNLTGHESWVVNHSVNAGGTKRAPI